MALEKDKNSEHEISKVKITKEAFDKAIGINFSVARNYILDFYDKDIDYAIEYSEWTKEKSIKNMIVYLNRKVEVVNRPRRYVYWTEFGTNVGTEFNSSHFAVVFKEFKYTAIVVPLSTIKEDTKDWKECDDFLIPIGCLNDLPRDKKPCFALINQIRTISKKRLSTYKDTETNKYINE